MPEYLLTDGAEQFDLGFKAAFKYKPNRIMCWAHVERAVEGYLKKLKNRTLANQVLDDFRSIQLSSSIDVFELANHFFLEKYRALKNEELNKILELYAKEWVNSNLTGWHEGLGLLQPSTNNSLESTNCHLKEQHTFRAPLAYSRSKLFTIIKRFS